jgi:acyl-coenzyme A synthetase/AMP-(fatty) acid ligase
MAPDEFISAHQLTIWFSVPSLGMMLRNLRRLQRGRFTSLRWSLFCGERLPADVAEAWQAAAPNSTVENLYGPTEATIACTLYRWGSTSSSECIDGVVPIGAPFPAMTSVVVDEALDPVAKGHKGELCIKGPQVTHGYWKDPTKTADRFVAMPWYEGPDNRWYRTGDLALVNESNILVHCGRNDDQVKLRGFRIELTEVEHAIREAAVSPFVAVLPYPANQYGLQGLTAVVAGSSRSEAEILDASKRMLPDYMVPGRVVFVEKMPLNANGKIDKPALLMMLRSEDET